MAHNKWGSLLISQGLHVCHWIPQRWSASSGY